jgi:hypothetical protein
MPDFMDAFAGGVGFGGGGGYLSRYVKMRDAGCSLQIFVGVSGRWGVSGERTRVRYCGGGSELRK